MRKQWKPLPYSILFKKWGEYMKQKNYMAGLYYRLSQEDERQGESVSIDNQRTMLRKYAEEHGIEIYDEYIDDGVSGTTFQRPEVQRLLDDAKTGVINTIIVKTFRGSAEITSRWGNMLIMYFLRSGYGS